MLGGPPAGCVQTPWPQEPPSFQCDLKSSRSCSLFIQPSDKQSWNANSQPGNMLQAEIQGESKQVWSLSSWDSESRVGTELIQQPHKELEHSHCVQCCREESLALRGLSRDLRRSGRSGETSLKAQFWGRDLQDELES